MKYAGVSFVIAATCALITPLALPQEKSPAGDVQIEHFEKNIRPLLANYCWKCHGERKQEAGLRLDSRGAALRGGDSGAAIVPGEIEKSLLMEVVGHQGDIRMPPDKKLSDTQIAALATWIRSGANWPKGTVTAKTERGVPLLPNDRRLIDSLQIWLHADDLELADGDRVAVWPDRSGHARDFAATKGVRKGGVGEAPQYVAASSIQGRPAVRFGPAAGMATSPDCPVEIRGDAELTIVLVMKLQPNDASPPYDGILGLGNPANPNRDPGRPLAALVQISRPHDHELQLAGGWNHDATLGTGSMDPFYDRTLLLTIEKRPGPMRTTTQFFLNGLSAEQSELKRQVQGVDTVPDIQHRQDIGAYLGNALSWCGSFRGDLAEVIVFNRALSDEERQGVDAYLIEKYELDSPQATPEVFTDEQRGFWAFQPVHDGPPPELPDSSWATSLIDRYLLARLKEHGLTPAPPADKRALIRRATFDLTGLPPTPEEIESFLADSSPDAFAELVERLLASPHYGERWGRHWLDVVRFAETTANDANAVMRYAFRYRDYVVDAFNRDLPYDRFLVEQLAGDLLPPANAPHETARQVIATGFLMVGPKALAETDKEQTRMDIVDEQLDVTGRAFLGLTLACARCHDHKFDPILTTDYYALAGVFRSTEPLQDEVRNSTMFQEYPLELPGEAPLMVMAVKEGKPQNLRVHIRGNRFQLGKLVPRRLPLILTGGSTLTLQTQQSGRLELARWIANADNPLTARVMVNRIWQHHFGKGLVATSDNFGLRGERPSHPELLDWLAARFIESGWSVKAMHRLMLNSTAYQMASSPNSVAERIDPDNRLLWHMPRRRLEAEEIRDAMLAVSGQLDAKVGGGESAEILYKEAEILDAKRGFAANRVQTQHPFYDTPRRSLYLPAVRNALPDSLSLFDAADPNGVSAVRDETTVPAQSLYLLNNAFVRAQAGHLADLAMSFEQEDDAARIGRMTLRCLGRQATDAEITDALAFLQQYTDEARRAGQSPDNARHAAWQSFCQVLINSNEFLYLE